MNTWKCVYLSMWCGAFCLLCVCLGALRVYLSVLNMCPFLLCVPVRVVCASAFCGYASEGCSSLCCVDNLRVVCPSVTWIWVRGGGLCVCLCPKVLIVCLRVLSVCCWAGWLAVRVSVQPHSKACSGTGVGGGSFHRVGLSMCGKLWVWLCRSEF